MMFRLILFFYIFYSYQALGFEFACNFEEVYIDGQTQQGLMLIKKNKLRYEYIDKNLFTIIHKNNNTTISKNTNRKHVNDYEGDNNLIEHLISITNDFPNFKEVYNINNFKIIVENSSLNDFIKRMAVVSDDINLSINFLNCKSVEILDLYFQHNPYFRFSHL